MNPSLPNPARPPGLKQNELQQERAGPSPATRRLSPLITSWRRSFCLCCLRPTRTTRCAQARALLLPASPDAAAQYVLKLKAGERPVAAISVDTAAAFVTFLFSPPDQVWKAEGMGAALDPVGGRGSAWPAVRKAATLCAQVESAAFGFLSNFASERVVSKLAAMKKGHVERGASNFDIVQASALYCGTLLSR